MPKRRAADKLQQNKFKLSSEVSKAITNNIQRQDLTLQPVNRSSSDLNRENTNNFLRDQQQNIPATTITSAQLNRAIAVNQEETRRIKSQKIRANDEGFEFNQVEVPQPLTRVFLDFDEVTEIEDTLFLALTTRNRFMDTGDQSNLEQQQSNTYFTFALINDNNVKKSPDGFENFIFPQAGFTGNIRYPLSFKRNKKYRFDLSDLSLSSIHLSGFKAFNSNTYYGANKKAEFNLLPTVNILTKSSVEPGNPGSFLDITLTNNISTAVIIDYSYDLNDPKFTIGDRNFFPNPFSEYPTSFSSTARKQNLFSINSVDTSEFFAISASFDPYATTLRISAFENLDLGNRKNAGYHLAGVDRIPLNPSSTQPSLEFPIDITDESVRNLYYNLSAIIRYPLGTNEIAKEYTQPKLRTSILASSNTPNIREAKPTIEFPRGIINPLNETIFARPGDKIIFTVSSLSGSFNTSDGQVENLSGDNVEIEIKMGNDDIYYFNSLNNTLTSGAINSTAPGIISCIPGQTETAMINDAGMFVLSDNEDYLKDTLNSQYQKVCETTRNIFASYLSTFPENFFNKFPSTSSFAGPFGNMNILRANGESPRGAKYGWPKFSLGMKKYFRDTLPKGSLIPGNQTGIGTLSSGNPDFWGWNARKLLNFSGVAKFQKGANAGNEPILLTPRHAVNIVHYSTNTLLVPGDVVYFYDNTTGQPISAVVESIANSKNQNTALVNEAINLYTPYCSPGTPTETAVIKFTEPLTAHDVKSYKLLEQSPVFNLSAIKPGMVRRQVRGGGRAKIQTASITFDDILLFDTNNVNPKYVLPSFYHAWNAGFGINNSANPDDSSIKWGTFSQYTTFESFYVPSIRTFDNGFGKQKENPHSVEGALSSLNPYAANEKVSFFTSTGSAPVNPATYIASISGLTLNKLTENLKINSFGRINSGDSGSPFFVLIEDELVPTSRTTGGNLDFLNNKQYFQHIIDGLGNPENFQVQTMPMTGTGL